jgi:thiol-disulfide isomerase/thioredoxin
MSSFGTALRAGVLSASFFAGTVQAADSVKAINFQFTDVNGKSVQLSDFKGKWVMVNFWAPWCPLCWVEVPTLNELNKRKDFVVIGVGLDYGPDAGIVKDTAERKGMDFTAVVAGGARRNPDSPFRQVGPVDFYPTSYVYDPTGEIVMFIPGQVRANKVLAFMEEWKSKQPPETSVATKSTKPAEPAPPYVAPAPQYFQPAAVEVPTPKIKQQNRPKRSTDKGSSFMSGEAPRAFVQASPAIN